MEKRLLTILILLCAFSTAAGATTINAASCQSSAIQSAISSANDGDTVMVPAGVCTWNSDVDIPSSKGIVLQGSGSSNTIINVDGNMLHVDSSLGNSPLRITGFYFKRNQGGIIIRMMGTAQNWRIDNNVFDDNGVRGPWTIETGVKDSQNDAGYNYGVIDSNQFINRNYGTSVHVSWSRGSLDSRAAGDWIWSQPAERGTAQAVYIEDNTFSNSGEYSQVMDNEYGAKVVVRYNTIHNPWISTHSGCTNHGRDPIWTEIYKNKFTDDGNAYFLPIEMRSTSGIVWGNYADSSLNVFSIGIDHERSYRTDCGGSYGDTCDGGSSFDEN